MEFNKVTACRNHEAIKELAAHVVEATKFQVDLMEVFGVDKCFENFEGWFNTRTEEAIKWITPPYQKTYIELHEKTTNKAMNGTVAFYMEYDDGLINIYPLTISNGVFKAWSVRFTVGITRQLTFDDYCNTFGGAKSNENILKYNTWKAGCTGNGHVSIVELDHPGYDKVEYTKWLGFFAELLEVLLYINTRGVGTTTHVPPTKVNTKRVKRGANPLHEFKTLRIIKKNERRDVINTNWGVIPSFWSTDRREHTVRGHMAIYTKERPLFGNPKNVGPIWISPHIRCKGTEGGITKNYIVE